ncbi:hypothetical protein G6F56_006901 [Rhizopus delemar]|uniref:Dioxygenase n=1 Tax=Rhizopus stolonifer TaxID=4846 RepID=A0A367JCX0_RHIST|nr:hypothetical protein G6F56_006901 [Rhizopus delemar]RCH87770.1 hypothetical protein CU098_005707 [Rhizopus stolonifer]
MHKEIQAQNTPECQEPIQLELISGKIPTWLNGAMYRIGPGTFNIKQENGLTFTIRHAFDGLPMVHRFQLNGDQNSVTYNSRHTAKSLEKEIQSDTRGLVFFGHVINLSFWYWFKDSLVRFYKLVLFPSSKNPDGASVGVTVTPNYPLPLGINKEKSLVTKTDANILQKIHADTLMPEKLFSYKDYDPHLNGIFSAAHHQFDPKTGEIFNFSLDLFPPKLTVFKISKEGHQTILANLKDFKTSYIHSFYLTENYIILPQSPLVYQDSLNILLSGTALSALTWTDQQSVFHVIHRNGQGLVASITAPPFFTFHVANAYEQDHLLILDACCFENADVLYQLGNFGSPNLLRDPAASQDHFRGIRYPPKQQVEFGNLLRHKLDLNHSSWVSTECLAKNIEFPRFDQQRVGKDYASVYGCERVKERIGLIKVDIKKKKTISFETSGQCSEPIFVPGPLEEEGVLLTLLNDQTCFLLVLDAGDLKELARFKIGEFNAVTFHGSFVDYEFQSINVN